MENGGENCLDIVLNFDDICDFILFKWEIKQWYYEKIYILISHHNCFVLVLGFVSAIA